MSCEECSNQDGSRIAYWRHWDGEKKQAANIGLIGCERHIIQVLEILNKGAKR